VAQNLANLEQQVVEPLVAHSFGNHLLQISMAGAPPLYRSSPIANKTTVHFDYPVSGLGQALVSEPDYLAVATERVDALILHHVLEFATNPHQVLREAQRVTAAGGQLFVIGFNPWSLWSLRKCFSNSRSSAPWRGNYLSSVRVSDWLNLLDFQIQCTRFGCFHFPVNNERLINSCRGIERLGQKYNCLVGGFYVMVARKQIAGLIPLRDNKIKRRILRFPITEPTTRSLKTE